MINAEVSPSQSLILRRLQSTQRDKTYTCLTIREERKLNIPSNARCWHRDTQQEFRKREDASWELSDWTKVFKGGKIHGEKMQKDIPGGQHCYVLDEVSWPFGGGIRVPACAD